MTRTTNPVRFGISVGAQPFDKLVAVAQAAEANGFSTISFADQPPSPAPEAWTVASAIGALTKKLVLTHATLNVPFRHPAVTAKMAASLDTIAGSGRVELTMGAGGQQQQYESYGLPYGTPGERFEGLRDAVAIMRGLWANDTFSYDGPVYSVKDATIGVRPAGGSIPVWIGALGPRMMRYTGRVADGWMKNRGLPADMEELRGLIALLETGAEQAGRDPRIIRRVLNSPAALGEKAMESLASGRAPGPAYTVVSPFQGTPEQVIDAIERFRDEGIDTFHFRIPEDHILDQIPIFGEDIIPNLR
jgi:alkanesulfonate monooxygenase SsuD/methylene tetrahydromethanopterin reductase-like flavin-dependent oxidoreductase (luciferase family)